MGSVTAKITAKKLPRFPRYKTKGGGADATRWRGQSPRKEGRRGERSEDGGERSSPAAGRGLSYAQAQFCRDR